jgi:hypothetical protein
LLSFVPPPRYCSPGVFRNPAGSFLKQHIRKR